MTIPPRFLDEIRSRLTLSSVIGKRVKVTRAGREYKACCPFHKEKSPSFTINDDKQFYHCFGCGAHGDVIGFIMQHDNLSFVDAVEMLAAEAGLQMPRPDPAFVQKSKKEKSLHDVMDQAAQFFAAQLQKPENREVVAYLDNRGLDAQTRQAFRIGFAPVDRQVLRAHLKSLGVEDKDMMEAGLIKASDKSSEPYAFFRDRVMFPVTDRRGRVIAFGGRILPDHMRPPDRGDYKPAKYINSGDTPLFDKSRVLYAEAMARQAAREGRPVIVTEGYMDVIACHKAGFRGAVAPMGTALTDEQIISLWSMIPTETKVPVLCFDGDNAGRQAAARACERVLPLLKPGQSVSFVFLPDGEDPDSLLSGGGAQAFEKILQSPMSLFDFVWLSHTAGRDFSTPEARAGMIKAIENHVKTIADRDVQRHYQELVKARVEETFFRRRPFEARGGQAAPAMGAPRLRTPSFHGKYARVLLAAVINHPFIFGDIEEALGTFDAGDPAFNRLRQGAIDALAADPGLDGEGLRHHLSGRGLEKEVSDILCESIYVHGAFARPEADPQEIARLWLEMWKSLQNRALKGEIRAGLQAAVRQSSEAEEEKIMHLMQAGAGDAD